MGKNRKKQMKNIMTINESPQINDKVTNPNKNQKSTKSIPFQPSSIDTSDYLLTRIENTNWSFKFESPTWAIFVHDNWKGQRARIENTYEDFHVSVFWRNKNGENEPRENPIDDPDKFEIDIHSTWVYFDVKQEKYHKRHHGYRFTKKLGPHFKYTSKPEKLQNLYFIFTDDNEKFDLVHNEQVKQTMKQKQTQRNEHERAARTDPVHEQRQPRQVSARKIEPRSESPFRIEQDDYPSLTSQIGENLHLRPKGKKNATAPQLERKRHRQISPTVSPTYSTGTNKSNFFTSAKTETRNTDMMKASRSNTTARPFVKWRTK